MKTSNYVAALAILACLAGCEDSGRVEVEAKEGVIPEYQLKALDSAKETEQLLKESEEKRRKSLEGQG